ncbi:hypothetical protein RvY_17307 [Ramazzottius varieornatus]|uniref:Uncharacterized protein n=1 Tax=Ramazzottius varieornatus TaxID=947166 RepID=A0A1D1W1Q0_RAMVA|nr:hypothetical protein RvY_17307 [Ramazzottius varieornatus]
MSEYFRKAEDKHNPLVRRQQVVLRATYSGNQFSQLAILDLLLPTAETGTVDSSNRAEISLPHTMQTTSFTQSITPR